MVFGPLGLRNLSSSDCHGVLEPLHLQVQRITVTENFLPRKMREKGFRCEVVNPSLAGPSPNASACKAFKKIHHAGGKEVSKTEPKPILNPLGSCTFLL